MSCGYSHCHRGYIIILVVEEQDSTFVFTSAITIFSTAHDISYSHMIFQNADAVIKQCVHEVRPVLVTCICHNNCWKTRKKRVSTKEVLRKLNA